jgi:lipopolysaccharide export system permease protein
MRILYRLIGTEMFWPFIFGVAAFTSIFFAGQNLLKLTNQILNGLSAITALELVLLSLPQVIIYTLPMSALLAVLIGFSRLSGDSEVVAMYASGISLYRAIIPVVVMGIIVTGVTFGLSEVVVPASNRLSLELQARVLKEEVSTNKPFVVIDKGTNCTIYVKGGFNAKSRTMHDVTITRYNDNEPSMIFQAKEAHWEGRNNWGLNTWSLSDGRAYALRPDGSSVVTTFNGLQSEPVKIQQSPQDIALNIRKPEEMTFRELRKQVESLKDGGVQPKDLLKLEVELYNKLAIPFAALVFALIGAPLAVKPTGRAGRSVGIGFSILIIFAYWFLWHFTSAVSVQGGLPPIVGTFMADVLGLVLGIFLLIRTPK